MKSGELLKKEEYWNIITHGIGFILSIIGLYFLVGLAWNHNNSWGFTAAICFGISMVVVYISSTLYHLAKYNNHPLIKLSRTIDHIAIFYLIAGTYTPFLILILGNGNGKIILYIIWAVAAFGTLYKLTLGQRYPKFSLLLYIAMGWLIVLDVKTFYTITPSNILLLLLFGGMAYMIGTYFYAKTKMPFNHVIWHLCVLAGSAFHFMAVWELYSI
jgi:hemolysin III